MSEDSPEPGVRPSEGSPAAEQRPPTPPEPDAFAPPVAPEVRPLAPGSAAGPFPVLAPEAAPRGLSESELKKQRTAEFHGVLKTLTPRVYVTPLIIVLNLLVFGAAVRSGVSPLQPTTEDLLKWGADFGPSDLNGEWWRLLTCTFVHIGLFHLVVNMLVLGSAGPLVERLVGNVGFLVLYLVSGLFGSLASLCYHPLVVSAGASGAVFGVYGALIVVLRRKSGAVPAEVLDRIRKGGMAFVGYNLVFGFMSAQIDNAAHIGGLCAGVLCGLALNLPLAPDALPRRAGRNILAAALGVVLLTVGYLAVNVVSGDLGAAMAAEERFVQTERRVLDVWKSAQQRIDRRELSDAAYADVLERDILPAWRASVEEVQGFQRVPADLRRHFDEQLEYMRLRQKGWELEVQAARERNEEKFRLADEQHERANRLAQKMNPSGK